MAAASTLIDTLQMLLPAPKDEREIRQHGRADTDEREASRGDAEADEDALLRAQGADHAAREDESDDAASG
jgi:hypothetical protein